jgi:hypothetical protein
VVQPHVAGFLDVARTGQPGVRLEELQITKGLLETSPSLASDVSSGPAPGDQ